METAAITRDAALWLCRLLQGPPETRLHAVCNSVRESFGGFLGEAAGDPRRPLGLRWGRKT